VGIKQEKVRDFSRILNIEREKDGQRKGE